MSPQFNFDVKKKLSESKARLGVLQTPHGELKTPAFIFCGTKAAIKGLNIQQMIDNKTQIILSNTYHLMLQPGADLIEKMGGLHKFTGWDGPMLTDSGGFQVFSMGHGGVADEIKGRDSSGSRTKSLLKITEEGALFKSYIDGQKILLTPESSMNIQKKLGADLIVAFDECTAFHNSKNYTAKSMERTHRWAERCVVEFDKINTDSKQALYGVVQGGVYEDLRCESIDCISSKPFFGLAIGGSLGGTKDEMFQVVNTTMTQLYQKFDDAPPQPIHLLGIGEVEDIWNGVEHGIDTFDCVSPTRLARHGGALIHKSKSLDGKKYRLNIRNAVFKEDHKPIDEDCACYTCQNHSRAYLHHLFKAGELLGMQLMLGHNVFFMNQLMETIRTSIQEDRFLEEKKNWP